jgi:hypothetical protein
MPLVQYVTGFAAATQQPAFARRKRRRCASVLRCEKSAHESFTTQRESGIWRQHQPARPAVGLRLPPCPAGALEIARDIPDNIKTGSSPQWLMLG